MMTISLALRLIKPTAQFVWIRIRVCTCMWFCVDTGYSSLAVTFRIIRILRYATSVFYEHLRKKKKKNTQITARAHPRTTGHRLLRSIRSGSAGTHVVSHKKSEKNCQRRATGIDSASALPVHLHIIGLSFPKKKKNGFPAKRNTGRCLARYLDQLYVAIVTARDLQQTAKHCTPFLRLLRPDHNLTACRRLHPYAQLAQYLEHAVDADSR